jgi:hypothetical protein
MTFLSFCSNRYDDPRRSARGWLCGLAHARLGTRYATGSGVSKLPKVLAIPLVLALTAPALLWAAVPQTAVAAPDEATAIRQFNEAIAKYMALRSRLRGEVSGPVKNSTSSQVSNASDALAAAIERGRPEAQLGSIFAAPVAAVIKRRIADAVRTEKLASVLADIDDEGTPGPAPKVHLRLPVSAQMATMPPSLLKVLPPLPKELEYRILGRYLVLRDVDASLILDYIPSGVPR